MCAIDLFSKFAWAVPLKDKRGITIVNVFQKILDRSNRKLNKTWVHQGEKFYNYLFKRFLKNDNIDMYSTHNEGTSAAAEMLIRTLKNKIFKHMAAISESVYLDVLDDIVNKCKNTVHRTIKTKPVDVTSDSYDEYNEDSNEKDPKFKFGDRVRISKYVSISAKGYTQN